jgi:hypothetical protein
MKGSFSFSLWIPHRSDTSFSFALNARSGSENRAQKTPAETLTRLQESSALEQPGRFSAFSGRQTPLPKNAYSDIWGVGQLKKDVTNGSRERHGCCRTAFSRCKSWHRTLPPAFVDQWHDLEAQVRMRAGHAVSWRRRASRGCSPCPPLTSSWLDRSRGVPILRD